MTDHSIPAHSDSSPLPADDLTRSLTVSDPDDPMLPHVSLVGDNYTVVVSGRQTAGRYCLIDMLVPDGGGPPPHRHDFEEMFTLLEGQLEFTFRGETRTVKQGMTINIPANAPHFFKNASGKTVRMLCMCTPAGADEFFMLAGDQVESRQSPPLRLDHAMQLEQIRKIKELAPKYRTEILV